MMDNPGEWEMECEALRAWMEASANDGGKDEGGRSKDEGRAAVAFGFFVRVLGNAVESRPTLEEMGYRVWIMASRVAPAQCPHSRRADLMEMRRIAGMCNGHLSLGAVDAETAGDVFDFVFGGEKTARLIGRRVSILAYGFNKSAVVRAALPSMESIGRLWNLRARNKRSAVSAAAKKMLRDMQERLAQRRGHGAARAVEFWFAKKKATREKYEAAQMGNGNRLGDKETGRIGEDEEKIAARREAAALRCGIPVKAEYAAMTPELLKTRLRELREMDDLRRLGAV